MISETTGKQIINSRANIGIFFCCRFRIPAVTDPPGEFIYK